MTRKDIRQETAELAANLLWSWSYDVDSYSLNEIKDWILNQKEEDISPEAISTGYALYSGDDLYVVLYELLGPAKYVSLVKDAFERALEWIRDEREMEELGKNPLKEFSTDDLVKELVKRGSIK